jgi:hypothetical protein
VIQEFDNFDARGWELLSLLNFHIPQEIIETEIYTKFERERLRIEGEKPGLRKTPGIGLYNIKLEEIRITKEPDIKFHVRQA